MGSAAPSSSSLRRCRSPRAAALASSSATALAARPAMSRPAATRTAPQPRSAAPAARGWRRPRPAGSALPMGPPGRGPAPAPAPAQRVPVRCCRAARLHLRRLGEGSRVSLSPPGCCRPAHLSHRWPRPDGAERPAHSSDGREGRAPGRAGGGGAGLVSVFYVRLLFYSPGLSLEGRRALSVPDRPEGSKGRGRGGAKVAKDFNESGT